MKEETGVTLALLFTFGFSVASWVAGGWWGYRAWHNWEDSSLFVRVPLSLLCFSLVYGLARQIFSMLGVFVVAIITSAVKPRR